MTQTYIDRISQSHEERLDRAISRQRAAARRVLAKRRAA